MYPVAYGLFESETKHSWKWFMENLHKAIGSPPGLVISIDAGKGIDHAVTNVFSNGVEHRKCMRHLWKNFQCRFRGEVFQRNLWPASRAYRKTVHLRHYNEMKAACPVAIKWIEDTHKHVWARCYFSTTSKCDYVTVGGFLQPGGGVHPPNPSLG
jgi:transposase-like protein